MERSIELRGLALAIYEFWSRGDPTFLDLISDSADTVFVGTDPVEWIQGGPAMKAVWRQQTNELAGMNIVPGALHAFTNGDTGWVVDDPSFALPNGVEGRFRTTLVFAKEPSGWKIVHVHFSLGQSNEDALGLELTTSIDALAEWAIESRPDLIPTASPEGTVTIAFTDLEASTATNERLGDARFAELIRRHDELVRRTVAEHGGTAVNRAGDGFMLAFPSARAGVGFAIAMQRLISDDPESVMRMRVGIHTGEPLRHGDDFFGRDVAYAARVGSVALGGEILVSELVKHLCAGSSIGFNGTRDSEFKGFDGPQTVHIVTY